jgi:protein gp37
MANRFGGHYSEKDGCNIGMAHYSSKDIFVVEKPLYKRDKDKMRIAAFPYGFTPTLHRYRLDEPQKLKKPSIIGIVYMGDLFGEWVPDEWIKEVFNVVMETKHTYLFLTKNPKRYDDAIEYYENEERGLGFSESYWNNCWFGTTVTCQKDIYRAKDLLNFDEGHKFLSIEPIFGEVNLSRYLKHPICKHWTREGNPNEYGKYFWERQALVSADWHRIEWVIIGQQTGPRAKPPNSEWVQSIIDQCKAAEVPVFVKSPLYEQFPIQEFPEGI